MFQTLSIRTHRLILNFKGSLTLLVKILRSLSALAIESCTGYDGAATKQNVHLLLTGLLITLNYLKGTVG